MATKVLLGLLAATALTAVAGGALAQAAPAPQAPAIGPNDTSALGEIVVTSTRQEATLNRVPLSVSAINQEGLDKQGIRNVFDLARTMPGLSFREFNAGTNSAAQGTVIAIRGIVSTAGASTTGVYLDDIPLHLRSLTNAGSGFIFPRLFDLDRVEVLRGPQGTLYGGSSQGGAVRFITPSPSLTRYSVYARGQASTTEGGDPSAEIGLAVGGPIVPDRLGFRLSGDIGRVGGYVDHIAPSTGKLVAENTNKEHSYTVRGALLWAPTEHLRVEPAIYLSLANKFDTDGYWNNVPAYTLPSASYGANGQAASATNPAVFTRPALNYPALNYYGVGKTGELQTSPRKDRLDVYSFSLEYDFGWMVAKSITGYKYARVDGAGQVFPNIFAIHAPLFGGYNQLDPNSLGNAGFNTTHRQTSQELRFSSRAGARLSWVAGLFYNNSAIQAESDIWEDLGRSTLALRGVTPQVFYNSPFYSQLFDPRSGMYQASITQQKLVDISKAAFIDATFALTEQLKATAGVRASDELFKFNSCQFGFLRTAQTCTVANTFLVSRTTEEKPVTPKVGLSYQIDPNDMVYANVSKGFRSGGVNVPVPNAPGCAAAVAAIGKQPETFKSDSVTNYEVGGKFKLLDGRAQINTSLYQIDWQDIQLQVALPGCSFTYTANAGTARSKGFDVQSQLRVFKGLVADVNVGYTDAKYTQTVANKDPAGNVVSVVVFKGDTLPVPKWTVDLGLTYSFPVMERNVYARLDYQFTGDFKRTFGPGSLSYSPDLYRNSQTQVYNARVGADIGKADVSLFVLNLFNSNDVRYLDGGRQCGLGIADPTCSRPTATNFLQRGVTFRPREVGITVTYRH